MKLLRVKDSVNLVVLEKFGFRYKQVGPHKNDFIYEKYISNCEDIEELSIRVVIYSRIIQIYHFHKYGLTLSDTHNDLMISLFELFKNNYIEEVEIDESTPKY